MTTTRKVRKDFDRTKEYSVTVVGCTKEEKEEVQQAFFDAGIIWELFGAKCSYFGAVKYTNRSDCGDTGGYLFYGDSTIRCNMTPIEFLDLVYEPEQQGHVHAESMAQYAEDAKTHDEPWKLWQITTGSYDWIDCKFSPHWSLGCEFRRKPESLDQGHIHAELMAQYAEEAKTTTKPWEVWQVKVSGGVWQTCHYPPTWGCDVEYRRKPKTHIVHGVEIPDLRIKLHKGQGYWYPDVGKKELAKRAVHEGMPPEGSHRLANNLCYEPTEDGRQAAILHAKAWLGIA